MARRLERAQDPTQDCLRPIEAALADIRRVGDGAPAAIGQRRHRVAGVVQQFRRDVMRRHRKPAVVVGGLRGHRRRNDRILAAGKDEHALARDMARVVDQLVGREASGRALECRDVGAGRGNAAHQMRRVQRARASRGRADGAALAAEIGPAGHDTHALDDGRVGDLELHRHERTRRDAGKRRLGDVDVERGKAPRRTAQTGQRQRDNAREQQCQ